MKPKSKPGSKIPTTKTNTNTRKISDVPGDDKKINSSLIKKNEFALILLGALLLTTIIFLLFFRSSGSKPETAITPGVNTSFADLDKRIQELEKNLPNSNNSLGVKSTSSKKNTTEEQVLSERVARLETAFSVKFDSLADRMLKIERSILALNQKSVAQVKAKSVAKPKVAVKKIPAKKAVVKKPIVKKEPMFHTVKKGETLYSIGKKYNIKIDTLRKLNKLSKTAKIYPGDNLLIK